MQEITLEKLCTQCPLAACDEEHLFCLFRLVTGRNNAQRGLQIKTSATGVIAKQRIRKPRKLKVDRREYFQEYHEKNREKRNAIALERYHEKREVKNESAI